MLERLSDNEVIGVIEFIISCISTLIRFIHDSTSFSSSSFLISWIERITNSFSLVLKEVALRESCISPPPASIATSLRSNGLMLLIVSKSFLSFLSICCKCVSTSIASSFFADEFACSIKPFSSNEMMPAARCSSNVRKYCSCCRFSILSCWIW